jgi:hypothetical protein
MAMLTIYTIPDVLKNQFKDACVSQNKSMARVIKELMSDYVVKITLGGEGDIVDCEE